MTEEQVELAAREIAASLREHIEAEQRFWIRAETVARPVVFCLEELPVLCLLALLGRPGARQFSRDRGWLCLFGTSRRATAKTFLGCTRRTP